MFDWIKSRTAKDYIDASKEASNVYKLPEPKLVPPMPQVEPPKHDPVAYRIGKTEEGKVTLSLGDYPQTTVTMNNAGVDQLIRMLEAAKNVEGEFDDSNL
jgi:hypothetical protein